jgi:hypothetical protein
MLQESKVLKFLGFMWNPLSWVMEAAAIMAIALAHGGENIRGKVIINHRHTIHYSLLPPHSTSLSIFTQKMGIDYNDFVGIMLLLIINSTISFIEENNAGNAAAALMARLAPKAKVKHTYCSLLSFTPSSKYCSLLSFTPSSKYHFVLSRFYVMEPGVNWTRLCWFLVT